MGYTLDSFQDESRVRLAEALEQQTEQTWQEELRSECLQEGTECVGDSAQGEALEVYMSVCGSVGGRG